MRANDACVLYEEFAMAGGQCAVVARLGSRFFVLRGPRTMPLSSYEVSEPFEEGNDAIDAGKRLAKMSYHQAELAEASL
jgi:hypothetical protein